MWPLLLRMLSTPGPFSQKGVPDGLMLMLPYFELRSFFAGQFEQRCMVVLAITKNWREPGTQ